MTSVLCVFSQSFRIFSCKIKREPMKELFDVDNRLMRRTILVLGSPVFFVIQFGIFLVNFVKFFFAVWNADIKDR